MTNSPYILWTDFFESPGDGYIFSAPVATNTNGAISIDPSRNFVLPETSHPIPIYSGCAVFEFNNSPYIVWIADGARNINMLLKH